jgi:hypothetical protein
MDTTLLERNFTAPGGVLAPPPGNVSIYIILVDIPATVIVTDGLGAQRLYLVFGAPGLIVLPGRIFCQNGAVVSVTDGANVGIFYGT